MLDMAVEGVKLMGWHPQIRSPKSEIRRKSENRSPKAPPLCLAASAPTKAFPGEGPVVVW
jgi:hypothetical protein